jgi:hypothetical protein
MYFPPPLHFITPSNSLTIANPTEEYLAPKPQPVPLKEQYLKHILLSLYVWPITDPQSPTRVARQTQLKKVFWWHALKERRVKHPVRVFKT